MSPTFKTQILLKTLTTYLILKNRLNSILKAKNKQTNTFMIMNKFM